MTAESDATTPLTPTELSTRAIDNVPHLSYFPSKQFFPFELSWVEVSIAKEGRLDLRIRQLIEQ